MIRIIRYIKPARNFSLTRVILEQPPTSSTNSFNERERAYENVYVKKKEAIQLKKLKQKLEEQKKSLERLEQDIKGMQK